MRCKKKKPKKKKLANKYKLSLHVSLKYKFYSTSSPAFDHLVVLFTDSRPFGEPPYYAQVCCCIPIASFCCTLS